MGFRARKPKGQENLQMGIKKQVSRIFHNGSSIYWPRDSRKILNLLDDDLSPDYSPQNLQGDL